LGFRETLIDELIADGFSAFRLFWAKGLLPRDRKRDKQNEIKDGKDRIKGGPWLEHHRSGSVPCSLPKKNQRLDESENHIRERTPETGVPKAPFSVWGEPEAEAQKGGSQERQGAKKGEDGHVTAHFKKGLIEVRHGINRGAVEGHEIESQVGQEAEG